MTPAFSHFISSLTKRLSPIQCSMNFFIHAWSSTTSRAVVRFRGRDLALEGLGVLDRLARVLLGRLFQKASSVT
jgi:hypothetical protein